MYIIGITGTLGAGKGTIVDYLVKSRGFVHFSAGGFIHEQLIEAGLPTDRDHLHAMANKLRAEGGADFIIRTLYERAAQQDKNVVIEAIHTPGEAAMLKQKEHFALLGIDAPLELRYERIRKRGSSKDDVTFEKFKEQQELESSSDDPTHQNLGACIKLADYVIINNGDMDTLYKNVEAVLEKIGV